MDVKVGFFASENYTNDSISTKIIVFQSGNLDHLQWERVKLNFVLLSLQISHVWLYLSCDCFSLCISVCPFVHDVFKCHYPNILASALIMKINYISHVFSSITSVSWSQRVFRTKLCYSVFLRRGKRELNRSCQFWRKKNPTQIQMTSPKCACWAVPRTQFSS